MQLSSPEFVDGGRMPKKYSCDGDDINPELRISGVPSNAVTFAMIVDDPDAPNGTWVHWVLWNIPASIQKIDSNSVPAEAVQGTTSSGKNSYGGPCPPSGTHRYFFKLYALDTKLELDPFADSHDLETMMNGHIIAQTELVGLYCRDEEETSEAKDEHKGEAQDRPNQAA